MRKEVSGRQGVIRDLPGKIGLHFLPGQSSQKLPMTPFLLTPVEVSTELNDAHACEKKDAVFQAARTRRSGSLCEP